MNTDTFQNNSQTPNAPEQKPAQEDPTQGSSQASEPQAEVSINQAGLRVEVSLSWKHCNQLVQGAKKLIPYVATIGLTTLGTNPKLIQQFYPQPGAPAPVHQIDSQRPDS